MCVNDHLVVEFFQTFAWTRRSCSTTTQSSGKRKSSSFETKLRRTRAKWRPRNTTL